MYLYLGVQVLNRASQKNKYKIQFHQIIPVWSRCRVMNIFEIFLAILEQTANHKSIPTKIEKQKVEVYKIYFFIKLTSNF